MDGAAKALWAAAYDGDVEAARPLLAAAPNPAAAAALAAAVDDRGWTALHMACMGAGVELVRLLLNACPALAARGIYSHGGRTPLHLAVLFRNVAAVRVLLEEAPAAALAAADSDDPPISFCFVGRYEAEWAAWQQIARMLIALPNQQPHRVLRPLARSYYGRCSLPSYPALVLPLFADVATRYPLSPADWHLIPSPCPGLATALPTVLQRSPAEAALLVARLPEPERSRLCTAALALHRAQAVAGLSLPQPLVQRILAAAMA